MASPLKRFGAAPQAARTVSAAAPPPPQPTSTYTPSVRSFLTAIDRSFLLPSRNSCLFSFPAAQNLPPRKSSRSHLCHHPPFRQVARQASVLILSASYFLLWSYQVSWFRDCAVAPKVLDDLPTRESLQSLCFIKLFRLTQVHKFSSHLRWMSVCIFSFVTLAARFTIPCLNFYTLDEQQQISSNILATLGHLPRPTRQKKNSSHGHWTPWGHVCVILLN